MLASPLTIAKILIMITIIAKTHIQGLDDEEIQMAKVGMNLTLTCLTDQKNLIWKYNDEMISPTKPRFILANREIETEDNTNEALTKPNIIQHNLTIHDVHILDEGIYKCNISNTTDKKFVIKTYSLPKITSSSNEIVKVKIEHSVTLYCLFNIYPQNDTFRKQMKWLKDKTLNADLDKYSTLLQLNETHVNYTLQLDEVNQMHNGTYECVSYFVDFKEAAAKEITLLVMSVPQVSIDYVKSVGANKIFLNWTINNDGNDKILKYFIQYMEEGTPSFTYYHHEIEGNYTSYILEKFHNNTSYWLRISAKNSIGESSLHQYPQPVRTLEKDPIFIPKVETTGSTASTITIGWNPPSQDLLEFIQYYELVVLESGESPKLVEKIVYQQNSRNLPYMFDNLKTASEYEFKIRACSDLTKLCGPWSDVVNGTTMDGMSSKPTDLKISCYNVGRLYSVNVTWKNPKSPNGKVVSYLINLNGQSMYKDNGRLFNETWGPKTKWVVVPHHKTVFDRVNPNTNYTVTVSAITRHRKIGETAVAKCSMPVAVPELIRTVYWTKLKTTENKSVFKLVIPKISERNGPICCYRLYVIKMGSNYHELPSPELLNISTYREVHLPNNTFGGAYIAEMFSGDHFRSEIFLGDGKRYDKSDEVCRKCLDGKPFLRNHIVTSTNTNNNNNKVDLLNPEESQNTPASKSVLPEFAQDKQLNKEEENPTDLNIKDLENKRRRRRMPINTYKFSDPREQELLQIDANAAIGDIFDGEIDMSSNYTGFLEVIVRDKQSVLMAYSNYFDTMTPKTAAKHFPKTDEFSDVLDVVIQILAALIGLVLVLFIFLCFLHHYNTKNNGPGEEAISLRDSLSRALFGNRTSHRHFIGSTNAKQCDIGPISKSDLYMAYKNRHKDTDYGFLREYEMLPNRFSDRTTKNSDLKENSSKNRYPDIKAFDQTRVKLFQINGIQGSDYINANFVIGYKERKKFICAQGPMESTINDFWRMIWEQHLEIIVMLTNLEEYNKSKCAKYWPEKVADLKQFGDITVKFVSEKKLGDYLIRNLDIFRRTTGNEDEEERRQITQYHYLVWKDFMAPEHPQGIIKFIRHINAVYSLQRGPILVHCSAGVGRTGTLVALDSLMQQLEEEEQVSIYNTVCDLRHQRNFLVQSLKQYIFLYRALLDTAYFGNTELSAIALSTTIDNLKIKLNDGKDKCKLENEFEKLLSIADESNKPSTIGNNEENISKNRSEVVIPYDRNRVILAPIPVKENSTYINASFIEGYDNSDTFIITQDPMENTIGDFWRMISEQSISTLVMISEIGDGLNKCPRYWADDEIQYDHIVVKYMQSESCPYYTRREFNITNCKIDDTIKVTQFQYNGWPTVDGEMPEVCRGIIELVDQAQNHHNKNRNIGCRSPITVHCSLGTDRSSIFVAMCILVQQLRTEKIVDICSTAKKLRSQRSKLLNTYAQYEFLHRAIANYADLHKLSTESPSEC